MSIFRQTYLDHLIALGLSPLFVSCDDRQVAIDALYEMAHGVLLIGGPDFDPHYYDAAAHKHTEINEPKRDDVELYLAKCAIRDGKPIFGICRGAQCLAIAGGGTLIQHIPDLGLTEVHGNMEGSYDQMPERDMVTIFVQPTSITAALLGKTEITAYCGHHQSVEAVGSPLVISGWSKQGIAEIIELPGHPFCIGVQSHPEIQKVGEGDLYPLWAAFASVCRAFMLSLV